MDDAEFMGLFERAGFLQRAGDSPSYPNGVRSLRMAVPARAKALRTVDPGVIEIWAEGTLR